LKLENIKIAIVGLGYVGLPLAIEFGKKYSTIGFDINQTRIDELNNGYDRTKEIEKESLISVPNLSFSTDANDLKTCNIFIITVPTPIDDYKKPDLTPLVSASRTVGKCLSKGAIVVYESTVYPGCTEDDCVPILEKESGLIFNQDFFCGYSPERINPGDKVHTVTKIRKITSGSTSETAEIVDNLYKSIIEAGTYKAQSIKVAEAAKIIENCQRDINIAFVNELAIIFDLMNIDTLSVLEAAGTKWNFLPFRPGLVGGHCIGVDPYYLTHKAEYLGYRPEVILSGRRINDNMGHYIANKVVKLLIKSDSAIKNTNVLILGFTFKENCPDVRNTRVIDIYEELINFSLNVDVCDPWANPQEVKHEYGIDLVDRFDISNYKAIILAVGHEEFLKEPFLSQITGFSGVIYDVKSILNPDNITDRL
jgi:UDP-N-acetyl-D-glucosamine/UDP-N-acetyl-D-galactosamine dehydrogenase